VLIPPPKRADTLRAPAGFVPDVDMDTGAWLFLVGMMAVAVPVYADASGTAPQWLAPVFYAIAWSANYMANLENGRDACATTAQGTGTVAAKIAIVGAAVLNHIRDAQDEFLSDKVSPAPTPPKITVSGSYAPATQYGGFI